MREAKMRRTFLMTVAALAVPSIGIRARADSYPSKPIRLIIGFPAGSGTDFIVRTLQPKLQALLGQPIIVDNKPGGAGILATTVAANAAPDGYTLVLTVPGSTSTARAMLGNKLQYAPEQLVPVGLIGTTPLLLLVSPTSGVRNLAQFTEIARKTPGGLNVASYGVGSPAHFAIAMYQAATGLQLTHVPFQGPGPAQIALMAGDVQALFDSMTGAIPQVIAGKLVALATTASKRIPQLPEAPTFAELNLPSVQAAGWAGLHAPRGTPGFVVERLNAALNTALESAEVRAKLTDRLVVKSGTPAAFAEFVQAETVRLEKLIKDTKLELS